MNRKSQTLEAPSGVPGAVDVAAIGAPASPQVNLLPPEIRSNRALARVKVRLLLALLVVVLVGMLAFVYAILTERTAAADLARAQKEAQDLVAEQATYAEVPAIKDRIEAAEDARAELTETEVLWSEYLGAIQAVTPPTVALEQLSTMLPGPLQPPTPSGNPLDALSIGQISFTATSATLPDMAAWMDVLDTVPGFADPTYTTADLVIDEAFVGYTISVTIQVDPEVFAHRFVETDDAGAGDAAATGTDAATGEEDA